MNKMTQLRIIARLWAHITDLQMLLNGQSVKSIGQIETEMDETASYCQQYADDSEDIEKM